MLLRITKAITNFKYNGIFESQRVRALSVSRILTLLLSQATMHITNSYVSLAVITALVATEAFAVPIATDSGGSSLNAVSPLVRVQNPQRQYPTSTDKIFHPLSAWGTAAICASRLPLPRGLLRLQQRRKQPRSPMSLQKRPLRPR
jgi:hypothetical protein